MGAPWQEHERWKAAPTVDPATAAANKAKATRLRKDAKLLDTGMDPDLVRELHAEADALDPPASCVLNADQWAQHCERRS